MKRNEDRLRDFWHNTECTNIYFIGVPKGEEKEKGHEKIFEEIIDENFPNMGKQPVTQVQEMQSPIQDKCKEEYTETLSDQMDKN